MDERFRTMRLEDGEQVIRLRGAARGSHKSDRPHSGTWGHGKSYLLVPCQSERSLKLRLNACPGLAGLENRSGDVEILLIGPEAEITHLIANGPAWCRAQKRRPGRPAPHLDQFKFRKAEA